eukprot:70063_1
MGSEQSSQQTKHGNQSQKNKTQKLECKHAENNSDETDEKKTDYDLEEDEHEDLEEVCVSGGSKRLEIYDTGQKNDIIVQCIGQLRGSITGVGGGYILGTG